MPPTTVTGETQPPWAAELGRPGVSAEPGGQTPLSRCIGIDLGTSTACVAVVDAESPRVIPASDGSRLIPTVVARSQTGEWLVGQRAQRHAATNPQQSAFDLLRLFGRRFDSPEIKIAAAFQPFDVVRGPKGEAFLRMGGEDYSPAGLCALVLRDLRVAAEEFLSEPVQNVVLSVPAGFNMRKRQLLMDAARIAGLRTLRLIVAPAAAALAYGARRRVKGRLAICDLGGGSLDVAFLEIEDESYKVLATRGDRFGGEDFDQLIAQRLLDGFHRDFEIDLTRDRLALYRLKEAGERARIDLTHIDQSEIDLPFIASDKEGAKHLHSVLDRRRFDPLVEPMLERLRRVCEQVFAATGLGPRDIDEVITVGGLTRTPVVFETIRRVFEREPKRGVNPDEAVALGAAVQAGQFQPHQTHRSLTDVTACPLGIETEDGRFIPIVGRSSPFPVSASQTFTATPSESYRVRLWVVEEETPNEQNVTLGGLDLELPNGDESIGDAILDVTIVADGSGALRVSAEAVASGSHRESTVYPPKGLAAEDVERYRREFDSAAERDRSELERARASLSSLLTSVLQSYALLSRQRPRKTNPGSKRFSNKPSKPSMEPRPTSRQ